MRRLKMEGGAPARHRHDFPPTLMGLTPTVRGNYFLQRNPDPNAVVMQQLLSITLAFTLTRLIPQPGAAQQAQPSPTPGGRGGRGGGTPPPIQAKPEELAKIKEKTEQIDALVKDPKTKRANPELVGDVEVYAHAGKMLLEYPDMFANQNAIEHAFATLDQGIERGKQLQANQPQWNQGKRRIHAYTSEIDGAVLPYGVTLPDNYDPSKPARLYVWLHGRQNTTTETEFIYAFLSRRGAGNPPVADQGQIQLDCFGRINGAGWHWAGEADVFESIAAVKKRFSIDEKRVMIRGFSQGGEGAWHISLHHPDRFAAAEIGAGTVSRTAQRPGLTPYQLATLRIWVNISEWALNIHNLPLAGHDGENDPGQLESSLRARAQLEKEGFPSVGDPDYLRFPIERELSSHDLPEPAQSREIRRTQHRPHHRRPRLQRRLRHAALGRLRHRQSETGRSHPGHAHDRPLRRTLAVGEITAPNARTSYAIYEAIYFCPLPMAEKNSLPVRLFIHDGSRAFRGGQFCEDR